MGMTTGDTNINKVTTVPLNNQFLVCIALSLFVSDELIIKCIVSCGSRTDT